MKGYRFGKARESGLDPYEIITLLENEVLRLCAELHVRDESKINDKEDRDTRKEDIKLDVRFCIKAMVSRDTEKKLTLKKVRDGIKEAFAGEIKKRGTSYNWPFPSSDRRLNEALKPILEEVAPYTLGKKGRPKKNK